MSRTVMEKALAALEYANEDWEAPQIDAAIAALRAALAEPQGEPVAWMKPDWLDPNTRGWPSQSFSALGVYGWLPLYTHPAPDHTALLREARDELAIAFSETLSFRIAEAIARLDAALEGKHE